MMMVDATRLDGSARGDWRRRKLLSIAKAGTNLDMAMRKATPERSTLVRAAVQAFARRQRTDGRDADDDDSQDDKPAAGAAKDAPAKPPAAESSPPSLPSGEPSAAETSEMPVIRPPEPMDEPWPEATPEPMRPVDPARARTETVLMPQAAVIGAPPAMPTSVAPPPLALGTVEDPTHMPGPRQIPEGNPEDPAPAPGRVPRGDSRSMRRGNEFVLVYRVATYVISRFGTLGQRGQWRVVEYPTSTAAAHSYAKECSRFVAEGFSDYRD
jgi:hypothetical protein